MICNEIESDNIDKIKYIRIKTGLSQCGELTLDGHQMHIKIHYHSLSQ